MTDEPTTVLPSVSTEDGAAFLSARALSAEGHEGAIFDNVFVEAGRGQLVAIAGQGGTGRTSLLLTLTGRFKHSAGTVSVDGHSEPKRVREYAAIASAGPAVEPDEYLTVGALISERLVIGGAEITPASVVEACALFGIDPDSGTLFGHLDAPTKILFALALATAEHRPIIAVDDVDAGLDRRGVHRVWSALRTLADHGHLVLATTAQPDMADVTVHLPAEPSAATRIAPRAEPPASRRTGLHRAPSDVEKSADDTPTAGRGIGPGLPVDAPETPARDRDEDGPR
ncbi:ATP-binding cassette domain-containing protein [Phytomonospora sp. NPDC050363]|uniref:ABC transporter ATP-binding protein n=1 Tax=Phytomonospora sp. NPDC050363 TaxID=3155642 RepID=UPI0033EBBE17